MKKKRFSEEKMVSILHEADAGSPLYFSAKKEKFITIGIGLNQNYKSLADAKRCCTAAELNATLNTPLNIMQTPEYLSLAKQYNKAIAE